jgi:hypothetical protein
MTSKEFTLPAVLADEVADIVAKVMHTDGRECRIVERLLGLRPWPEAQSGRRQWSGVKRLWETLQLVPLAHDGILRVDGQRASEASTLVMQMLQPLTYLSLSTADPRALLCATSRLVKVSTCYCTVHSVALKLTRRSGSPSVFRAIDVCRHTQSGIGRVT